MLDSEASVICGSTFHHFLGVSGYAAIRYKHLASLYSRSCGGRYIGTRVRNDAYHTSTGPSRCDITVEESEEERRFTDMVLPVEMYMFTSADAVTAKDLQAELDNLQRKFHFQKQVGRLE